MDCCAADFARGVDGNQAAVLCVAQALLTQDLRGLVAEPAGPVRGTAIAFHGNAGHAGHRVFYAAALTRLGWRVILAEYPGYGPRGGLLGEESLTGDAEQTVALAHRQYGAPLLLMGESLGAAVAAAAAARQPDLVAGLLLIKAADHNDWTDRVDANWWQEAILRALGEKR